METTAKKFNVPLLLVEVIVILLGLLFLVPFYFLLANSVKSYSEILSVPLRCPLYSSGATTPKLGKLSIFLVPL